MTYVNRVGEEFVPVGDLSPNPAQAAGREMPPQERDGLYFRSRVFPGLAETVQSCIESGEAWQNLTLDAYQAWCETGWKLPHVSPEMNGRLHSKAREEAREVLAAFQDYWRTSDADHLMEEAGDFQWVTAAYAANAGSVVSDAVKRRLYDYAMGTRLVQSEVSVYPNWYDTAAPLAIKKGGLTLGDIDSLFTAGFLLQGSPAMNVYDDEDGLSIAQCVHDLGLYGVVMENMASEQEDQLQYALQGSRQGMAERVGVLAAEATLHVAAIAHHANRTFTEVVAANVQKVSHRIKTGTVDKLDGDRAK